MQSILSEINSYLVFGYSLKWKHPNYSVSFENINKEFFKNWRERELINEGVQRFKNVIERNFACGQTNVVPLSGGVDSRLLLAALAEFTDLSSIKTYTFGVPGTYDFDIANLIAKKYGTNHRAYNLNHHTYTMYELLDMSKRFYYQSPLFIHPPLNPLLEFKNDIIWSGVNAGAVVGSFLKQPHSGNMQQAKLNFLNKGAFVKSVNLAGNNKNQLLELMGFEEISKDSLTFDEQAFFKMRSEKHLAPNVLIDGFNYKTPFINNDFMDFMLSIDNNYRYKKYLYYKIAQRAFPQAFKLGIEGNYGLPINFIKSFVNLKRNVIKGMRMISRKYPHLFYFQSPMLNYIDFDKAIRERDDIKDIVRTSINDLISRNIIDWLDIDRIWKNHQNHQGNYADALIALASLEIHLKSGKQL